MHQRHEFAETTEFRTVTRTIAALSTQDERIAEEFRTLTRGRKRSDKIIRVAGDVPVGLKISFGDFAEAVAAQVWKSVARINFRPFEDAKTFVQNLNLKNVSEWRAYTKSGD
ncbi:MAG: hypothetical protein QGG53_30000, partial [Planctomycetota bacterium]|nr:hypothetical protein [Planctomycetota bacterium]